MREIDQAPPPFAGGQGRTAADVERRGSGCLAVLGGALVILALGVLLLWLSGPLAALGSDA